MTSEMGRDPAAGPFVEPPAGPTGNERVDEALARLGGLGGVPVARHVEVFEDVHRRLQEVLAGIDQDDRDRAGQVGQVGQVGLWSADGPGGG